MASDGQIRPVITYFKDIEPRKTEWLWPQRIPLGTLTLIVGNPNMGKTFLTMTIAAHVSAGRPWPDRSEEKVEAGSVVILTAEDDLSRTVRTRLEAAGADMVKVATLSMEIVNGEKKQQCEIFNLTHCLGTVKSDIETMDDFKLIIIDPISSYMGGKDPNSNTQVREFLGPLTRMAEEHNAAIVAITHFNKKFDSPAGYRTIGSVGFRAAARAVWLVVADPDDEERRLFLLDKCNLAKEKTGLAFRLEDTTVDTADGPADSAFCQFEEGAVHKTADEVLQAEHKQTKKVSPRERAKEWLSNLLPDYANNIVEKAEKDGIAERTLERAKSELGVESKWIRMGEKRLSVWLKPKNVKYS